MNLAVYPGSFDPITLGHLNIIERASRLSSTLVIAVVTNPKKQSLFSLLERQQLIARSTEHLPNVRVDFFEGLLVDYLAKVNAACVIKGLRTAADFDDELQMSRLNQEMWPPMETVLLPAEARFGHYSSTMVRQIASLGGDVSRMVSPFVREQLRQKFNQA